MNLNRLKADPTSIVVMLLAVLYGSLTSRGADFPADISSVIQSRCVKCHGKDETEGDVDLVALQTHEDLLADPELIRQIIEAVDTFHMPPDSEPELANAQREQFLSSLKQSLSIAISNQQAARVPIHRLNRFQYNHVVRDLFALDRDPFPLPERLMTRHSNYLNPVPRRMPQEVDVTCDALNPAGGMRDVEPFPKDLQAEHGYDNQADRLTLPPLLLDSMLDICVSILNSPDFHSQTVGIWNDYFAEPSKDQAMKKVLRDRIGRFTRLAFRGPASEATVMRYVDYTQSRLDEGATFSSAMKAGTAAILSSPKFLFRTWEASPQKEHSQFALASRLSFCLWGSCPDDELLKLAESGELSNPAILQNTVQRMLRDPKIARFLDSFPAQWMKLESILSAAPDPGKNRLYNIGKNPAGVHMVLEPLLVFDTVFLENLPLHELISPRWSWQNDFLHLWYTSDLKPPAIDENRIAEENKALFALRQKMIDELSNADAELEQLIGDARIRAGSNREQPVHTPCIPIAAWDFEGDLTDSIGDLDLKSYGDVIIENGAVTLGGGYLESPLLTKGISERTLEIWLRADDLSQRSAVAMALTNEYRSIFEALALGIDQAGQWSLLSNDPLYYPVVNRVSPETPKGYVQLVLTRDKNGHVSVYRNGQPYSAPNRSRPRGFRANDTRVMIGGLSTPRKPDIRLKATIDRVRLYDQPLTAREVRASYEGSRFVSLDELLKVMSPQQRADAQPLLERKAEALKALNKLPIPADARSLANEARKNFEAELVKKMNSRFRRVELQDNRYGGIITNAAVLTMTSAPSHTQPIARGVWLTEVVFNNPPPPPPNNVPALDESVADKSLTVRERFARHRADPDCAACHSRLDPLGFALENFDVVGRWRQRYPNDRPVDPSGTLLKSHPFKDVIQFKQALLKERARFARAFTAHFARFIAARELNASDALEIEQIVANTAEAGFRAQDIIQAVCQSPRFSTYSHADLKSKATVQ